MNHEQLAHVFAQGENKNRKSTNMFIEDNVIYSYGRHFAIAKHCGSHVMFTTRSYSHSTGKHISHVRHAIYGTVFYVDNVFAETKAEHKANYNLILDTAAYALEILVKGRSDFSNRLERYAQLLREANAYTKFFKLGYSLKVVPTKLEDLAEIGEKIRAKAKKVAVALRAKNALLEKEYNERWETEIAEWKAGERQRMSWSTYLENYPICLRLTNLDNELIVETSGNASFPVEHARKAWKFIKRIHASGKAYLRKGSGEVPTIRLGHFIIDAIREDGTVVAGCHTLKYGVMEDFAAQQGW